MKKIKSFVIQINDIDEITSIVSNVLLANGYTHVDWNTSGHYRDGKVKTYTFRCNNGETITGVYVAVSKNGEYQFCTTENIEIWKAAFGL